MDVSTHVLTSVLTFFYSSKHSATADTFDEGINKKTRSEFWQSQNFERVDACESVTAGLHAVRFAECATG